MLERVTAALAELEEDEVLRLVGEGLEGGTEPLALLRACQEGMIRVGERFEAADYFVSDLMMSGEIFKQVSELLRPHLAADGSASAGAAVVGTALGDIHDIGKDIVVNMLRSSSIDVTDLGVDVAPARFVEAVRETDATVVGISGLLTLSFDSMRLTVEALEQAGLRDKVRVMVGGGPVDASVSKLVGADDWGADAQAAVRIAKRWLEEGA